ncbi:hypothetical protein TIFTF001_001457 [Ficus carica]|uniref:BOP1 N-terminal domain-containing protein n=1 Tax=Ficus carica TaxID=3494 RepID=A0AA87ZG60_FICCA|nr:hypothetical protein TIFTF001_001457 [Ficus carica]
MLSDVHPIFPIGCINREMRFFFPPLFHKYTRQGSCVLALAFKALPDMTGRTPSIVFAEPIKNMVLVVSEAIESSVAFTGSVVVKLRCFDVVLTFVECLLFHLLLSLVVHSFQLRRNGESYEWISSVEKLGFSSGNTYSLQFYTSSEVTLFLEVVALHRAIRHEELYNPSLEYIPTQGEITSYQLMYEEDRPKFLPKRFTSPRNFPAYKNAVKESFERVWIYTCVQEYERRECTLYSNIVLFLFLIFRINIDPESLKPNLPSRKDFRPYLQHVILSTEVILMQFYKTASVATWHQDDKHGAIRLRHFKISKKLTQIIPIKLQWASGLFYFPSYLFAFIHNKRESVCHLGEQRTTKRLKTAPREISSISIHPAGNNVIVGSREGKCWFDSDLSSRPYSAILKTAMVQFCIVHIPYLHRALMIALRTPSMAWFIQISTGILLLFRWKILENIKVQMGEVRWTVSSIPGYSLPVRIHWSNSAVIEKFT